MAADTNTAGARNALVTGGNRGLGLETARQLARERFSVWLASRKLDQGEQAARSIAQSAAAGSVRAVALDVADEASIAALAAGLERDGVELDVLVNNAGISLEGFNPDVVKQTLATNFFGALRLSDALIPRLRAGANLVMVSSGLGELVASAYSSELRARFLDPKLTRAGLLELVGEFVRAVERGEHERAGWPSSAYRVSKAALNALTRLLARELAPRKIRVNAVCPGWVRTAMGGPAAARSVESGAASITWAAFLAAGGPSGGFFRDGQPMPW